MGKQFFTVSETVELLEVDEGLISAMVEERIITFSSADTADERLLPCSEVEKIRVAKTLVDDMGVNLPGVDVILSMRQNMIEMRRQFDAILKDMAEEVERMMECFREQPPEYRSISVECENGLKIADHSEEKPKGS